ncbi:MAG: hypothetical protein RLZZ65_1262 [Bacteroidota bacterium]|jgi:predicted amidohydrolase
MQNLKVGILQLDQVWENKEANFLKITNALSSLKVAPDLILLPEMFQTGFTMNISLAETMDGPSIAFLKELAQKYNSAFYTSLIIEEDEKYLNRGVFITPNGNVSFYDKRKSFGLGGEDQFFSSGQKENILTYLGWKFNLQICYDLRFPELIRNREQDGAAAYDVLLNVANWPQKRILHWDTLLRARAIENQCFTVACNRIGKDANSLEYVGHSQAVDMFGNFLLEPLETEGISVIEISYQALQEGRSSLPFLRDA